MATAQHLTYTVEARAEWLGLRGAVAWSVDGARGQTVRGMLVAVFLPLAHPLVVLGESLYHGFFDRGSVAAEAHLFPLTPGGIAPDDGMREWVLWGVQTQFLPGLRHRAELLYGQSVTLRHLLAVAAEIRDIQTVGSQAFLINAMVQHLEFIKNRLARDRRGCP